VLVLATANVCHCTRYYDHVVGRSERPNVSTSLVEKPSSIQNFLPARPSFGYQDNLPVQRSHIKMRICFGKVTNSSTNIILRVKKCRKNQPTNRGKSVYLLPYESVIHITFLNLLITCLHAQILHVQRNISSVSQTFNYTR
jgi:hypothetical protein